jgi:hypothetical protein
MESDLQVFISLRDKLSFLFLDPQKASFQFTFFMKIGIYGICYRSSPNQTTFVVSDLNLTHLMLSFGVTEPTNF